MGRFLNSLIEAGKCPLFLDYSTGSLLDLSGSGNHSVSSGNEFFKQARGKLGMMCPAGTNLYVPHHASLNLSTFTIALTVTRFGAAPASVSNPRILTKGTASIPYGLYMGTGSAAMAFIPSAGGAPTNVGVGGVYRSFGVTLVGSGIKPRMFWNESLSGETINVTIPGTNTSALNVGHYNGSATSYHFGGVIHNVVIVNEPLSDVDMVRLMRELEAGPTTVRRPNRHFSLPYPSKTPAEYAADSQFLDIKPATVAGGLQELTQALPMPFAGAYGVGRSDFAENKSIDFEGGEGATGGTPVGAPGVGATAVTVEWVGALKNNPILHRSLFGLFNVASISSAGGVGVGRIWCSMHLDGANKYVLPWNSDGLDHHHVLTWQGGGGVHHYIDGILRNTLVGPYAQLTGAWVTTYVNRGDGRSKFISGRAYTTYWDAAKVREEYLQYARKCLLDARVHSDGSCPVSLAAVGAPNEIANGWKVGGTDTWKVVEDAPTVPGTAGQRWIQRASGVGHVIYISDTSAYGSWYGKFFISSATDTVFWGFISQISTAYNVGYQIYYNGAGSELRLAEDASGIRDIISVSITGEVEFWIDRIADGTMTVWARGGGVWSDWTQVLQATDTTYTTSKFQVFNTRNPTKFAGSVHYLG